MYVSNVKYENQKLKSVQLFLIPNLTRVVCEWQQMKHAYIICVRVCARVVYIIYSLSSPLNMTLWIFCIQAKQRHCIPVITAVRVHSICNMHDACLLVCMFTFIYKGRIIFVLYFFIYKKEWDVSTNIVRWEIKQWWKHWRNFPKKDAFCEKIWCKNVTWIRSSMITILPS